MSEDPTLVDSVTLLVSLRRDIAEARAQVYQTLRWLDAAMVTVWELEGRERKRQEPAP